jgi:hypothetical protein
MLGAAAAAVAIPVVVCVLLYSAPKWCRIGFSKALGPKPAHVDHVC